MSVYTHSLVQNITHMGNVYLFDTFMYEYDTFMYAHDTFLYAYDTFKYVH